MKIKGISMMDLIREMEGAKRREAFVHEALARGKRHIVIDENIEAVYPYLKNKNYTSQIALGSDEQIKARLLNGAVFVTNNERHFIDREDRLYYNYGLVSVPNTDSKTLADYIEKCLMSANFANDLLQVWKIYNDGRFEKID